MNFLDLAKNRYTTKIYQNKKISEEKINDLKEILRLAPSSINSQPWRFIFVSDENKKQELAKVSFFNESKINNASHLVVFLGFDDLEKFESQIRKCLPEGQVNYYLQNVKPKGEEVTKKWLHRQVYISLGYFLSACASMGIDSTPMEGIQMEKYDEILQQDGYKTLFAVAIGYRDSNDSNQPDKNPKSRLPLEEVIFEL
ncbi:NAD(P)H-dependent oxidoreductase [Capnocytophaga cynodegmi]|uniref:Nitroreductase family protein n=1 Tax=Capnocytophaga cynodegmi TaxID=28189 RepID=A0A0B7H9Q3_9FLAO|nr:NAD(P)H-dependent oxidoreductase [Capnocytophaga cynodegmi]GIM54586.1 oxygen-insensitive NAD(P)H-dependent nitroreductase NfsB [Capnocytophaga cynodegmi]CEN34323.1 Nitroreductase family protein [Capnocytophaga cynodegmi]